MRQRRRIVTALTGVCLVLALAGAPPVMSGFAAKGNAAPAAGKDAPALAGPKEKRSYALGMVVGAQLRKQSVEVDPDLYLRGMKDALSGSGTLLTEKEAGAAVHALQQDLKKKKTDPQSAGGRLGIAVSFKLDPRIAQGPDTEERWVSPPTHTAVQEGKTCTLEARVVGAVPRHKRAKIRPRWVPADPGMVSVSPSEGYQVKITVLHDGESTLNVVLPGASRQLTIKATYQDNAIRAEISQ